MSPHPPQPARSSSSCSGSRRPRASKGGSSGGDPFHIQVLTTRGYKELMDTKASGVKKPSKTAAAKAEKALKIKLKEEEEQQHRLKDGTVGAPPKRRRGKSSGSTRKPPPIYQTCTVDWQDGFASFLERNRMEILEQILLDDSYSNFCAEQDLLDQCYYQQCCYDLGVETGVKTELLFDFPISACATYAPTTPPASCTDCYYDEDAIPTPPPDYGQNPLNMYPDCEGYGYNAY